VTTAPVLTARGLTKSFFGVRVLDEVSIEVRPGEVHGLVGENGAGKSTLMKILAGVYQPDGGEIRLAGEQVTFAHPIDAMHAGVATVFQEFNLLPERTVAQNVFLGREPRRRGVVDVREMARRTQHVLDELGVTSVRPRDRVGSLSVAQQQVVEIAKALSHDAKVISMDEPTAALAAHEVELLYRIVRSLAERGVGVLYVSHRLKEVFDLCDTITVLKDGRLVSSGPADELGPDELVRRMVGRSIDTYFPGPLEGTERGTELLRVTGGGNAWVDGIDLSLRAGEITAIAGLQGSGRTELAEAIFGIRPFTRGSVEVGGRHVRVTSPRHAARLGIALITEDRKATGLSLAQSILDNVLLVIRGVFPRRTAHVRREADALMARLELSTDRLDREVQLLSGGNQQKVVLGKWLATKPRVVILDEPTRGIDVGAKVAVYDVIRSLAREGVAICMISSELPELLGIADRVLVMRDGRLVAELAPSATEEEVLRHAAGAEVGA
jgi:ABC-type sugar transport system, ATPase component